MGNIQTPSSADQQVTLGLSNGFTDEELHKLAERFTRLDQNRDGVISREEIMAVPGLENNPLTDRLIELFDTDHSGTLDFNEFITGMSKLSMKGDAGSKLLFAFSIYDPDNEGFITNRKLFERLKSLIGKNVDDKMLQQIVDKTIIYNDKAGDGKINIKEFTDCILGTDIVKMNK